MAAQHVRKQRTKAVWAKLSKNFKKKYINLHLGFR